MYAKIECEDIDPNMVKLFRLSQMIIEYLLHSQSFLLSERDGMSRKFEESRIELQNTRLELEKSKQDAVNIKKDLKIAKKTVYAYDMMAKLRQEQGGATIERHKCQFCHKAFSTTDYRKQHEERRHSGLLSPAPVVEAPKETKKENPELQKILEAVDKLIEVAQRNEKQKEIGEDKLKVERAELDRVLLQKDFLNLRNEVNREMDGEISKLKAEREELRDLIVEYR